MRLSNKNKTFETSATNAYKSGNNAKVVILTVCAVSLIAVVVWFIWSQKGAAVEALEDAVEGVYEGRKVDSNDYIALCAEGDFEGARAVQAKLYQEFTSELGRWRSGEWRDRNARQAQERYHTAVTYIFGKEAMAIYMSQEPNYQMELINLLMNIPAEGAPLSEGRHGEGLFYDNDAGVGEIFAIDHVVYQDWARFYNDRCEQLIDMALLNEDVEFAKKVAKLYKTEVITRFEQDTKLGDDYRIATVSYDNSRKAQALARLNE